MLCGVRLDRPSSPGPQLYSPPLSPCRVAVEQIPILLHLLRRLVPFSLTFTAFLSLHPLSAQTPVTAAYCTEQDRLFTFTFDGFALLLLPLLGVLVFPFFSVLVSPHLRSPSWRVTRPVLRWLYPTIVTTLVAFLFFVFLPQMAISGTTPPEIALLVYPCQPTYLEQCHLLDTETGAMYSRGVLFGLLGSARTPAVRDTPTLLLALFAALILWSLLHWALFAVLRSRYGIRPGYKPTSEGGL